MGLSEEGATALFILGLVAILVFSAWLFWRTSDDYRIRQAKKELGYDVEHPLSFLRYCVACCLGPMQRRKWERDNKFFRTKDYGPPDDSWDVKMPASAPGQEWQKLPRGDSHKTRKLISSAVAKVKVQLLDEMVDAAVAAALEAMTQEMARDRETQLKMERMRQKSMLFKEQERLLLNAREAQERSRMEEAEAAEIAAEDEAAGVEEEERFAREVEEWLHANSIAVPKSRSSNSASQRHAPSKPIAASKPITIVELKRIARNMDCTPLEAEFNAIPLNLPPASAYPNENMAYNRISSKYPTPRSRYRFSTNPALYINANFARGAQRLPDKFIITQHPLAGDEMGKKSTTEAFWKMVWSQQISLIVMLDDDDLAKSNQYWASKSVPTRKFGPFSIEYSSERSLNGYQLTQMLIGNSGPENTSKEVRTVFHYSFTWTGDESVDTAAALLTMMHDVHTKSEDAAAPILIHCRDGFGPSGTVVALEHCIHQIETTSAVDVVAAVAMVREDRGGCVETLEQYHFIHKAMSVYSQSVTTVQAAAPPAYTQTPDFNLDEGEEDEQEDEEAATASHRSSRSATLTYKEALREMRPEPVPLRDLPAKSSKASLAPSGGSPRKVSFDDDVGASQGKGLIRAAATAAESFDEDDDGGDGNGKSAGKGKRRESSVKKFRGSPTKDAPSFADAAAVAAASAGYTIAPRAAMPPRASYDFELRPDMSRTPSSPELAALAIARSSFAGRSYDLEPAPPPPPQSSSMNASFDLGPVPLPPNALGRASMDFGSPPPLPSEPDHLAPKGRSHILDALSDNVSERTI
eukprot:m.187562 g.187562  ORF g.187562 m.187562 type:complete len:808 (+) comp17524_c0_seq1:80-2503(+)